MWRAPQESNKLSCFASVEHLGQTSCTMHGYMLTIICARIHHNRSHCDLPPLLYAPCCLKCSRTYLPVVSFSNIQSVADVLAGTLARYDMFICYTDLTCSLHLYFVVLFQFPVACCTGDKQKKRKGSERKRKNAEQEAAGLCESNAPGPSGQSSKAVLQSFSCVTAYIW